MRVVTVTERTLDSNALDTHIVTTEKLLTNKAEDAGWSGSGFTAFIAEIVDNINECYPAGSEIRRVIQLCYAQALRSNVGLSSPSAWPSHLTLDTSSHALDMCLTLYTSSGTEQDIIQALRLYGRDDIADRIAYLYGLASEDPIEDRMMIESLRNFARVMTNYPSLPYPEITVSPDGHAVAEWSREYGILAMEFTAVGTIRYAALPRMDGYEFLGIDGEKSSGEIMEATSKFMELLTS